jgi:hypothetical protein
VKVAGRQPVANVEAMMNARAGLSRDMKHVAKIKRRECRDLRRLTAAMKHLERLPNPGESFHCVNRGLYALWDLVPAIAELASPVVISELRIATLGFSKDNIDSMMSMIDTGKIGSVALLCSHYFSATSKPIYDHAAAAFKDRNQRFFSMRTHAKVLVIALSDGRRMVVEASANLRSCKNVEQFTLIHDSGVYEFHRQWIEELFTNNARPATNSDRGKKAPRQCGSPQAECQ